MFITDRRFNRGDGFRSILAASLTLIATYIGFAECNRATPIGPITFYQLQGGLAAGTGQTFQNFGRPSRVNIWSVAFTGDLTGPTATDAFVWRDDTAIAREGFPAPSTEGTYLAFDLFDCTRQINSRGDVVYIATLGGVPETADRTIYRNDTLIAREGDPAPSIADRLFVDFESVGIAEDGTVGFLAELDGATFNNTVIYFGDTVLYRQGDAIPPLRGIPPGGIWQGDFLGIQWNGAGDLLFIGDTNLLPGDSDHFLVRHIAGDPPAVELLLREGETVPQAHLPTATVDALTQPVIAENGDWGVHVYTSGVLTANEFILTSRGFYIEEGSAVSELPGVTLGSINDLAINSFGDVVYLANLLGDTEPGVDEGLFVNGCLITTDDEQVPGLAPGVEFSDFLSRRISITDDRVITFHSTYSCCGAGDGLFQLNLEEIGTGPAGPADLDRDGDIDGVDLALLLGQWTGAASYSPCPPLTPADLNGDCEINDLDLPTLLGTWT